LLHFLLPTTPIGAMLHFPLCVKQLKKLTNLRKKMREKKTMENRKDNKDVCAAAGKVAEKIG